MRDRGAGFDLEAIGDDRMGVRHAPSSNGWSVMAALPRIRSTPGEGTEIAHGDGDLRWTRRPKPRRARGLLPGPWRIVLVDDHAMFRAGDRHELGTSDRVTIVGEGEDVATAVAAIRSTDPDVVLLDVHLPSGGGAEVINQVHQRHPHVTFLALSTSATPPRRHRRHPRRCPWLRDEVDLHPELLDAIPARRYRRHRLLAATGWLHAGR